MNFSLFCERFKDGFYKKLTSIKPVIKDEIKHSDANDIRYHIHELESALRYLKLLNMGFYGKKEEILLNYCATIDRYYIDSYAGYSIGTLSNVNYACYKIKKINRNSNMYDFYDSCVNIDVLLEFNDGSVKFFQDKTISFENLIYGGNIEDDITKFIDNGQEIIVSPEIEKKWVELLTKYSEQINKMINKKEDD